MKHNATQYECDFNWHCTSTIITNSEEVLLKNNWTIINDKHYCNKHAIRIFKSNDVSDDDLNLTINGEEHNG